MLLEHNKNFSGALGNKENTKKINKFGGGGVVYFVMLKTSSRGTVLMRYQLKYIYQVIRSWKTNLHHRMVRQC